MDKIRLNSAYCKLISGKFKVRVEDKVYTIKPPTIDLLLEADIEYHKAYDDSLFDFMSETELLNFLVKKGIWKEDGDANIKTLENEIEQQKYSVYSDYKAFNFQGVKKGKERVKKLEAKFEEFMTKRHQFDHLSLDGYANSVREQFIIERSIDEVKPGALSFSLLNMIVQEVNKTTLNLKDIRYIAKNDPWKTSWELFHADIFQNTPLTEEQRAVAAFSQLYENIHKHPEPPDDTVLNDDILLDGWLIANRKDNKSKTNKTKKTSRIEQHKEIYMKANNKEQAQEIYNKNDPENRSIVRERQKIAGTLKESDLPDKKRELQLLATERAKHGKSRK